MSLRRFSRRSVLHRLVGAAGAFALAMPRNVSSAVISVLYVDYGEPIDVTGIFPGDWQELVVDGDVPLVVRHRTSQQIENVRAVPLSELPSPARDEERAPDATWLVVSESCTHSGCKVMPGLGPFGGWFCFCHGSYYDVSGRVRGGPAQGNLTVVRYSWVGNGLIALKKGFD
jgi:ubiquinol-cytochrome c reductase iron-sulfur subunit